MQYANRNPIVCDASKVRKSANIRNQYIDPGYQWESDNVTNRHHKRELSGQPFRSR